MKAHNKFFRLNTQEKTTIHNINMLSTIINCCYAVDNLKKNLYNWEHGRNSLLERM